MENTVNANFNYAECIKEKTDLFSSTYYNICDGTEQIVPHGVTDLLLGGVVGLILLFFIMVIAGIGVFLIKNS